MTWLWCVAASICRCLRVWRLSEPGHEAVHVFDLGLATATNGDIWNAALTHHAALITKDRDFVTLRVARREGPAIVWLRFGNCDTDTLIKRVSGALDRIVVAAPAPDFAALIRDTLLL